MSHRPDPLRGPRDTEAFAGALSVASPETVDLFGGVVQAMLAHRADTTARLDRTLAADPGLAMGHLVRGFGLRLLARWDLRPRVDACIREARKSLEDRGGSQRERALCSALEEWNRGAAPAAATRLDQAVAGDAEDLLAVKLAHACRFMMGDARGMLRSVRRATARLRDDHPGYGYVQGCLAFALEENGELEEAERIGRAAVSRDASDAWAVHAVAHVLLSNGRSKEGLAWLLGHEPHLLDCNNFSGHLAWHRALVHIELGDYDAALDLLDGRIVCYPPGDYRDVSNATSLLFRLGCLGVDVADRWDDLADRVAASSGDHGYAFADVHYVAALAAAGRLPEARSFVESLIEAATGRVGFDAQVLAEVGKPVAEAILALYGGASGIARDTLKELRPQLPRLGGSHAQRGFLTWLEEQAASRSTSKRNGREEWQESSST